MTPVLLGIGSLWLPRIVGFTWVKHGTTFATGRPLLSSPPSLWLVSPALCSASIFGQPRSTSARRIPASISEGRFCASVAVAKVFRVPSLHLLFGYTMGSTSYVAVSSSPLHGIVWTPSSIAPSSSDSTVDSSSNCGLGHLLPVPLDHTMCTTLGFSFIQSLSRTLVLHLSLLHSSPSTRSWRGPGGGVLSHFAILSCHCCHSPHCQLHIVNHLICTSIFVP